MKVSPQKLALLKKASPDRGVIRIGWTTRREDIGKAVAQNKINYQLQMLHEMVEDGLLTTNGRVYERRNPISLDLHSDMDFTLTDSGKRARDFSAGEDGKMKVRVDFDLTTREGKMTIGEEDWFLFVDDASIEDTSGYMSVNTIDSSYTMRTPMLVAQQASMMLNLKLRASKTPPMPSTTKPLDFGTGRQLDID